MELNKKNYFNVSDEVLRAEIGSRTNKIILLKENNQQYKNILTALVSNLNSLLLASNNNFKLSTVREKDLEIAKRVNQRTKEYYKSLISLMNSNEKNDVIEEKIRKLRNENKELTI